MASSMSQHSPRPRRLQSDLRQPPSCCPSGQQLHLLVACCSSKSGPCPPALQDHCLDLKGCGRQQLLCLCAGAAWAALEYPQADVRCITFGSPR